MMPWNPEKHDEDRLRSAIEAYHASALAYAAVKLGLPEKMGARPWTAEALAAELGLSPPHLLASCAASRPSASVRSAPRATSRSRASASPLSLARRRGSARRS